MVEAWRLSTVAPGYIVSDEGRVMCVPFQGEMPNGSIRWYGGVAITGRLQEGVPYITVGGKPHKVHRLVCAAFHGDEPFPGAVVMHLDENPQNNRAANLAWGTQKQNLAAPGYRAYLRRRSTKRKLTEAQAIEIKSSSERNAALAVRYGVSAANISNIRHGRSWRNIP